MTQEEKDLLLKDLCARLPYGVKVEIKNVSKICTLEEIDCSWEEMSVAVRHENGEMNGYDFDNAKPYLFPLSSMTEEQKEELFKFCEFYISEDWEGKKSEVYGIEIASRLDPAYCYDHNFNMWNVDMRAIDWLLKNHFDIYGLIGKGIALEATKGIYN